MDLKHRVAICIGSGQSVQEQRILLNNLRLAGAFLIGVNLTGLKLGFPQANVVYDAENIPQELYDAFGGSVYSPFKIKHDNLKLFRPLPDYGLSTNVERLHVNSGGAGLAISVAYALGSRYIVLVGYDYPKTKYYSHWYDPGIKYKNHFQCQLKALDALSAYDCIYNASPISTLTQFTKITLESVEQVIKNLEQSS